jgi:hypothetical protein
LICHAVLVAKLVRLDLAYALMVNAGLLPRRPEIHAAQHDAMGARARAQSTIASFGQSAKQARDANSLMNTIV